MAASLRTKAEVVTGRFPFRHLSAFLLGCAKTPGVRISKVIVPSNPPGGVLNSGRTGQKLRRWLWRRCCPRMGPARFLKREHGHEHGKQQQDSVSRHRLTRQGLGFCEASTIDLQAHRVSAHYARKKTRNHKRN